MIYAKQIIANFHWISQDVSNDHVIMKCDICKRRSSFVETSGTLSWNKINAFEKAFTADHRRCQMVHDYKLQLTLKQKKQVNALS